MLRGYAVMLLGMAARGVGIHRLFFLSRLRRQLKGSFHSKAS